LRAILQSSSPTISLKVEFDLFAELLFLKRFSVKKYDQIKVITADMRAASKNFLIPKE